jgi:ubiquinone/menaquinone biosynthesis C-methylase UbiE
MPKGRESEMPDESLWKTFFDAESILRELECVLQGDIVEFGCGYGTFTLPAARLTSGNVIALDIDPEMVQMTKRLVANCGASNVSVKCRDFMADGTGLLDSSAQYAMAFNILHIEHPTQLLREAYRVLKPFGKLAIIHWKREETPRGPSMEIRPSPEQCRQWGEAVGFQFVRIQSLMGSPWHWGMLLVKPDHASPN